MVGVDGRITQVRCKVCSNVERREKLLVPKIDLLWKHACRCKALVDMAKVKRGEYYYLGSNQTNVCTTPRAAALFCKSWVLGW
jgi:hypothetical protein